jgi:hypothetical protein
MSELEALKGLIADSLIVSTNVDPSFMEEPVNSPAHNCEVLPSGKLTGTTGRGSRSGCPACRHAGLFRRGGAGAIKFGIFAVVRDRRATQAEFVQCPSPTCRHTRYIESPSGGYPGRIVSLVAFPSPRSRPDAASGALARCHDFKLAHRSLEACRG